jgi:4-hydroxybenzoate polyprenyltransferase
MMNNYGIYQYYPRLRKIFGEKIVRYIRLCRPFTLLPALVAGVVGTLTPLYNITLSNVVTGIYIGVTIALLQGVGQILNQVIDVDLDTSLPEKRNRPIPSGKVTKEEASGIAWLLAIFAIFRAFTISIQFAMMASILLAFAVFYSYPPFSPRKINPILNTAWMAVSRGFIPMYAVWSIYGDTAIGLRYAVLALLWVMGFQASKDVPDIDGDRRFGIKTIPNIYGIRGLIFTMGVCTAVYTVMAAYFGLYPMLLVLPLAAVAMFTTNRKSSLTENTYSWTAFYIGLGLLYILMFLSFHLTPGF